MSITLEVLKGELKSAMLSKDVFKRDVLRPLIGDVQNALSQVNAKGEVEVIQAKLKSFSDACEDVIKVLDDDIAIASKRAEIALYSSYRVVQVSIDEIRAAVVAKFGEVISSKDRGSVMSFVKSEYAGRFDGSAVNDMVVGMIAK